MSIMETFPKRITELRKSLKMTQREFAKELNITAASVSSYENGAKFPSIITVYDIAKKFDVSIDWLCGNEFATIPADASAAFRLFSLLLECPGCEGLRAATGNKNSVELRTDRQTADAAFELFRMNDLYKNKTIDQRLYTLWIDDKIKQLLQAAEENA